MQLSCLQSMGLAMAPESKMTTETSLEIWTMNAYVCVAGGVCVCVEHKRDLFPTFQGQPVSGRIQEMS